MHDILTTLKSTPFEVVFGEARVVDEGEFKHAGDEHNKGLLALVGHARGEEGGLEQLSQEATVQTSKLMV